MSDLRTRIHAVIQASEAGWYGAECDEIAVVTQGRTLDEASRNLAEAVSLHLKGEDLQALGFGEQPSLNVILMVKHIQIELPEERICEFCRQWQVIEFALFGSVLRDDFHPDSDIDVMVTFHPDARPTFVTLDQMEAELVTIFQREVDLVTRNGIEHSRNYLRRQAILSSAQVIYATRSPISA